MNALSPVALPRRRLLLGALALPALNLPLTCTAASQGPDATMLALADRYWAYYQRVDPESATLYGAYQGLDRLNTLTLAAFRQAEAEARQLLAELEAMPKQGLSAERQLDAELLQHSLTQRLEGYRWQRHLMPFNQYNGVQVNLAGLVSAAPFETEAHYRAYLRRLRQIPRYFEQARGLALEGLRRGLVPPRVLIEGAARQSAALAAEGGLDNLFARPLKQWPSGIPQARRDMLQRELLSAIDTQVRPAYRRLSDWLARHYAPRGRLDVGAWALPDGERYYAALLQQHTNSRLSADEVHALGLAEVARIEAEMDALARQHGHADRRALRAAIHQDPVFRAASSEAVVEGYRRYTRQIEQALPRLFGRLPKAGLRIEAVPLALQASASTSYQQGTVDGSRPGQVWVNTFEFEKTSTAYDEATAYHEGLPGHHLQISIAQELPSQHPLRLPLSDELTAYVEGWGLYAEQLGKELGGYRELGSEFGRLDNELFRAIRLVVDTGLHHQRWTREQAIQYFEQHTGNGWAQQVDRYLADIGQALAYKMGQLRLLELRRHAEQALGARFDVRAFHDLVLGSGPLPLDLLEQRVRRWVAQQGG